MRGGEHAHSLGFPLGDFQEISPLTSSYNPLPALSHMAAPNYKVGWQNIIQLKFRGSVTIKTKCRMYFEGQLFISIPSPFRT